MHFKNKCTDLAFSCDALQNHVRGFGIFRFLCFGGGRVDAQLSIVLWSGIFRSANADMPNPPPHHHLTFLHHTQPTANKPVPHHSVSVLQTPRGTLSTAARDGHQHHACSRMATTTVHRLHETADFADGPLRPDTETLPHIIAAYLLLPTYRFPCRCCSRGTLKQSTRMAAESCNRVTTFPTAHPYRNDSTASQKTNASMTKAAA